MMIFLAKVMMKILCKYNFLKYDLDVTFKTLLEEWLELNSTIVNILTKRRKK